MEDDHANSSTFTYVWSAKNLNVPW